tara:strand:+ start:1986 stop:2861 length:876 start_codon:yes stop_codon:yes gene_type:complete
MALYSIDQFSRITGLNKIIIRTWERRYDFLTPTRTPTNIRTYNDDMLNKGIKFAILVENGHKISKLVNYNDEHLNNLIKDTLDKSKDKHTKYNIYISKFIESALYFNQETFNSTYDLCVNKIGIIDFYKNILIETMNKISILYLNAEITSANEHFLSENIRIRIANEIVRNQPNTDKHEEWILFLPENEYHDIGLLFTYLLLKKHKHRVIYLGQNTPRETLLQFNKKNRKFLCFLSTKQTKELSTQLCSFLNTQLNKSSVYVIDNEHILDKGNKTLKSIDSIDNFIKLLEK